MPLVAWSGLAYVVGLLAGFAMVPRRAIALALVALALALWLAARRRRRDAALLVVVAGALLVAVAETGQQARCDASLGLAGEWELRVDAPVDAGDVARGTVGWAGCRRRATVLVASGHVAPGTVAALSGRATVGERGLFVQDGALRTVRRDAPLVVLRARAGARIDRLFGADAPMVRALVIADMSAIPAEQRDRYASSGLVHMLSVSGLHVGIIAVALELLAAAARLRPAPARIGTLALLALYVAAIGAPPPAVRAAVMLGALLMTRLMQRPTSPWAILTLGAAAPLLAPRTVLDLGWQLSVAGTAALIAGGLLGRRVIPRTWHGVPRTLAAGAIVSVVATVATAPLVAWTFARVSLVGPLANLVADPVMGLMQPVLFLALCVPVPVVERLTADAAHLLLLAFDAVARAGASVPGGAPAVTPTTVSAIASGVAAVAMLAACASARPMGKALVALAALAVAIVSPLAAPLASAARGWTEVHMIDVGQGDAVALRTRAGRWILVDAGRSWAGGDAGRSTVIPYLARRGGPLALFVLSHPHADHVGGAASTLAALPPARFLDPGYVGTTPSYRAALARASRDGIPWQRVRPGDSLMVDEVVLTALAPDSAWAAGLDDANLASAVLVARVGGIRVLLTGDAEAAEEDWLLERNAEGLRADVLKVAHHGSRTSTTPAFLAAVRPRLALVSVGAHNAYGHPDAGVMQALHASGAQVLRTDRAGTIVVRTDGRRLEVEARGERWSIANDTTPRP